MKLSPILIGLIALIILLAVWIGGAYNRLVQLNAGVDTQWAQVETQYQRRFDIIPNLVESTKGVLTQEQEVFGMIAQARQNYAGAQTPDERAEAAGALESSLGRLLVIIENYPQLQSNQTVRALMDELAGTENRISVETPAL
jgi:LemA protein